MTHEQRIKALIEAGENGLPDVIANIVYDNIPWQAAHDQASEAHCDYMYDKGCEIVADVLNHARESIKLLAEIAEAAGKYRAAAYLSDQEFDVPSSETQSHANARSLGRKFDALLAKYKEAQDAE